MKAVIYTRVSTETQATEGNGLEYQLNACRDYARANGLEIKSEHEDAGISGAKQAHERPGLMAAIAALEPGDVLIVYKRDRLARDLMASLLIQDLVKKADGRIVSTQGEASDDDSPTGQFIRCILDGVAQYERAMIFARMEAGRKTKKARGERISRIIPYGQQIDATDPTGQRLIPDEFEQGILAEIKALNAERDALVNDLEQKLKDYNDRVSDRDALAQAWTSAAKVKMERNQRFDGDGDTWRRECGNRPYREEDERAIRAGK